MKELFLLVRNATGCEYDGECNEVIEMYYDDVNYTTIGYFSTKDKAAEALDEAYSLDRRMVEEYLGLPNVDILENSEDRVAFIPHDGRGECYTIVVTIDIVKVPMNKLVL